MLTTENPTPPAAGPAGPQRAAPALSLDGLTKRFGRTVAVDRLSLEVPPGVVCGFIGPNGAGKTTAMAMLLGLVRPSAGTATVLGHPLDRPASYMSKVGALIEGPALWPALTDRENLRTLATLGGFDPEQIPGLLELVGLAERGDDRFGDYSLGMKQRLGIAAALLGDPDLLVLDEPTNGLDPAGIDQMRRLIAGIRRSNRTVLVSSHLLGELEQICDWLIVIDRGSLLYQGPAEGFLADAVPVVLATPHEPADLDGLLRAVVAEGLDAHLDVDGDDAGRRVAVTVESLSHGDQASEVAAAVGRIAMEERIVLRELRVRRPDLEAHYLSRVQGPVTNGTNGTNA
jgi:ABC-2 type transport system ATP-binding protein